MESEKNVTNVTAKRPTDGEMGRPESTRGGGRVYVPSVDIIERDEEMLVIADVPGVGAQDVDVTYEQGVLEFHARVAPRQPEDRTNYLAREYTVGDYHRSFRLGEAIDPGNIRAEIKDGVLTLHLAKAQAAKKKQIKVVQA